MKLISYMKPFRLLIINMHLGLSSFQMCLVSSGAVSIRWFKKAIRTSACLKSQFSYMDSPRSGKRSDRIVW